MRTFLIDGFVAGTWRLDRDRRDRRDGDGLTLEAFGALTRRQRAELEAEAEQVARFLGASEPPRITLAEP